MLLKATNKKVKKKLTIKDQKKITNEFLEICDQHLLKHPNISGEKFIVAGGAPRDWSRKKLANDIDIFAWHWGPINSIINGINSDLKVKDLKAKLDLTLMKQQEYAFDVISKVYETKYKEQKFQLIFIKEKIINLYFTEKGCSISIKDIRDAIKEMFDFNICICFYDGNKVVRTDIAKQDFKNKTLSFSISKLLRIKRIKTLPQRSKKMKSYFPNYHIDILK